MFARKKQFEFMQRNITTGIDAIIIYSFSPACAVFGRMDVAEILSAPSHNKHMEHH